MIDREKAINGLEETEIMLSQAVDRGGEMAVMGAFKCLNCVSDALALLKEQEAVEPVQHLVYTTKGWFCGVCDGRLNRLGKYCSFCGRPAKWNE